MPADAGAGATSATGYYNAKQAVEMINLNPILFRWVVNTEGIAVPRIGNRAVYTEETLNEIRAVLDRKDPAGRFRTRAERKNGPRVRKPARASH